MLGYHIHIIMDFYNKATSGGNVDESIGKLITRWGECPLVLAVMLGVNKSLSLCRLHIALDCEFYLFSALILYEQTVPKVWLVHHQVEKDNFA